MANKFGIREICDVKFYKYVNGVVDTSKAAFEIDTAKTSTLETSTTTVYAQGGRGNARHMSWEGERTLTFTVEDALFTKQSIAALMGESFDTTGKISIKDTSTAGIYQIVASTLVRGDDGVDNDATITIHKAKLQSNLSLPFSPTGDPLAITFTFDAFPNAAGEFMTLECSAFDSTSTASSKTVVTIINGAKVYTADATGANTPLFKHNGTKVTFNSTDIPSLVITADDDLICGATILSNGDEITLKAGSNSTWYVV